MLGPPATTDWRALDLVEERPVITLRGQQFSGHGRNVLGDPLIALTWLANELRQLGVRQVLSKPFDPLQLAAQLQQVWEAEHG